jgi:hypothetical protein
VLRRNYDGMFQPKISSNDGVKVMRTTNFRIIRNLCQSVTVFGWIDAIHEPQLISCRAE